MPDEEKREDIKRIILEQMEWFKKNSSANDKPNCLKRLSEDMRNSKYNIGDFLFYFGTVLVALSFFNIFCSFFA